MRVLVFVLGRLRGGCEEHALAVIRASARAGHEVVASLQVAAGTRSVVADLRALDVPVLPWSPPADREGRLPRGDFRGGAAATATVLDAVAPDAVLMFLPAPESGLGVMIACSAREVPAVVVFCSVPPHSVIPAEGRARRAWVQRRQRWVVTSVDNRRHLVDAFDIPAADEVTVVLNGVDLPSEWEAPLPSTVDAVRAELRAGLGIPADTRVALTVARLSRPKGHHDLLAAIVLLPEPCSDVHFVWAGDGPDEDDLRAAAATVGLTDRVHFLGYRCHVAPLLHAADLFVLPTHCEGLSRAIIEAMQAGLPAVVSDASSNAELIQNGRHGLLFPVRDPAALASRLEYALCHPTEMRRMARAAQAKARRALTAGAMCDATLRVLDEVVRHTG